MSFPDLQHIQKQMQKIQNQVNQLNLGHLSKELAEIQLITSANAEIIRMTLPSIQAVARATKSPFRDFSLLQQQIFEAFEDIEELKTSDFPYRWLGALPLPTLRHLKHLYEQDRLDEVERYLVEALREGQTIQEFHNMFGTNPFFTDRLHIINDVITAHHEGRYSLSIPAAMAQIDGIICDFARSQGLRHNKVERALNALEQQGDLFLGFFAEHLRDQFFRHQRNPILHGNWLEYPSEFLSAECLWVLFQLADHSQRLDGPSEN